MSVVATSGTSVRQVIPFRCGAPLLRSSPPSIRPFHRQSTVAHVSYKVEVNNKGKVTVLDVPEGENILNVALEQGMDLPHDCKLGVCMTCPGKLKSGKVDQSGCMLSDDVTALGYTLLCVAQPTTDCSVEIISEDELLDLQLRSGA